MKIFRQVLVATVVGALSAGMASAQIKEQQPAEFPPSSYKGKQYVDSKGCVFIRAGIDGDVSWVPRVTRARKVICGFEPSLKAEESASAVARPAPQQAEQITLETADAATPAVEPVIEAKPAPVKRPAAKVRRTATPKPVQRAAPKPVVTAQVAAPQAHIDTACPNASPVGQRYLTKSGKLVIRCGPQSEPVGVHVGGAQASAGRVVAQDLNTPITVSPNRRIVPRHVAQNRVNTRNVRIPKGYKPAWNDDRLNPHRAEQTLAGREHMLLVWTNTVPRRLINRRTGRDVTASQPLVYPYIDIDTQKRELGEVSLVQHNGRLAKRVVRNPGAANQPVISTRSAPKAQATPKVKARAAAAAPARKQAVGGKRFVQIGHFSTKAKADKAAQYLASLGMRARIGKVKQGGKTYLAVQAGPFQTPKATQQALARLQGVGYSGAVARN